MANRNTKRKQRAQSKQLTALKQSNPNYRHYPAVPKRKSQWKGHKASSREQQGAVWPKIS